MDGDNEDCVPFVLKSTAIGAGVGTLWGAVESAWREAPKTGVSVQGIANKLAGRAGLMAALATTYAVGNCMASTVRGQEDEWNAVFGGMAVGLATGVAKRSMPAAVGSAVALGLLAYACQKGHELNSDQDPELLVRRYGLRQQ